MILLLLVLLLAASVVLLWAKRPKLALLVFVALVVISFFVEPAQANEAGVNYRSPVTLEDGNMLALHWPISVDGVEIHAPDAVMMPTQVPTPRATAAATSEAKATSTPQPTMTPAPRLTDVPPATATPQDTSTPKPSATPTNEPTKTPTKVPSRTPETTSLKESGEQVEALPDTGTGSSLSPTPPEPTVQPIEGD